MNFLNSVARFSVTANKFVKQKWQECVKDKLSSNMILVLLRFLVHY